MNPNTIEEGKTIAVVSYLTIIGSVIAIIMNNEKKNEFTSFHNRQGLGLCLVYLLMGYFIGQFDSWNISLSFMIGMGLLLFYGVISASMGSTKPIPFIGPLFQKIFSGIVK